MSSYSKILVAIDLTEEASQVLRKAAELSKAFNAQLIIAHVLEPVGYAYGGDIPMDLTDLQDQLHRAAREQLAIYGKEYNIPESDQLITVGRPGSEIHRMCEDHGVDLCLVGSHGRSGIQLLLGSTANSVLHGAKVDVLAVRIH